jgi:hypothetical protein
MWCLSYFDGPIHLSEPASEGRYYIWEEKMVVLSGVFESLILKGPRLERKIYFSYAEANPRCDLKINTNGWSRQCEGDSTILTQNGIMMKFIATSTTKRHSGVDVQLVYLKVPCEN